MEVLLHVKKMLPRVGVLAYQNYQKMKLVTVIVCAKIVYKKKYRKRLLKTDEITKELFEEEYRYQWKNRH